MSDYGISGTDERYYPATDICDWEPLHVYAGTDAPEVLGGWMFMEAQEGGWRYYKHSVTRDKLMLRMTDYGVEAFDA